MDLLQSTPWKVGEMLRSLFPNTIPCIRLSEVRHFLYKVNLVVSCSCCVCLFPGQLGYIIIHPSSLLSRPRLLLTHANFLWPVGINHFSADPSVIHYLHTSYPFHSLSLFISFITLSPPHPPCFCHLHQLQLIALLCLCGIAPLVTSRS